MKQYGRDNKGSGKLHDVDKCSICAEVGEPNPKRERQQVKKDIQQEIEEVENG